MAIPFEARTIVNSAGACSGKSRLDRRKDQSGGKSTPRRISGGNPFPPRGGRWPEGPDEGDRAERDGSDRATRGASLDAPQPCVLSTASGVPRSHLAPLDPHPPCFARFTSLRAKN